MSRCSSYSSIITVVVVVVDDTDREFSTLSFKIQ